MKKLIIFITLFASILASCAPQGENTPADSDVPTESISVEETPKETSPAETESVTEALTETEAAEPKEEPSVLDRYPTVTLDGSEYHILNEGIYLAGDRSIHIDTDKIPDDPNAKITSALAAIGNIEYFGEFFGDEIVLSVDGTLLRIIPERDPESDRINFYAKSVTARGRTVSIAADELPVKQIGYYDESHRTFSPISILSDGNVTMYISSSPSTGAQEGYIFTDTGMGKLNDYDDPDCATSYYMFDYDENGRIAYTRKPSKYFAAQQYIGMVLQYCVSRDELACEKGYVTFDTGIAAYHPEEASTVDEVFGVDDCYTEYKKMAWESGYVVYNESDGYHQFGGIPLFDTLDELLAYNSARYPRAE